MWALAVSPAYLTSFLLRAAMHCTQQCSLASGCSAYCQLRTALRRSATGAGASKAAAMTAILRFSSESKLLHDAEEEADRLEQQRQAWLETLPRTDAEEILFQLEVRLKALDRFFNLDNHPSRSGETETFQHNFAVEIGIVDRQLRQILRLAQQILDAADTNALFFRAYVESRWLSDAERDAMISAQYREQTTPLQALYTLLTGLRSLADLSSGLRAAEQVRLPAFRALGQQYRTLLVQNRFFNPLERHAFHPISSWIENVLLRKAIEQAPTVRLRRSLGFVILILGRYITLLSWINPNASTREEVMEAFPLLSLMRSEFRSLVPYLEKNLPQRFFPEGSLSPDEETFLEATDAFAIQLQVESNKAFRQMLFGYTQVKSRRKLRGMVEAVHGLLTLLFEQVTVSLIQIVSPELKGRDLFPDFVSRYEQSARLREDLWIFSEVLQKVIRELEDANSTPEAKREGYKSLLYFLNYFENLSFQSIRQTEFDSFQGFFNEMRALRNDSFLDISACRDTASNFECFQIFIQTVIELVGKRAELRGLELDEEHARTVMDQFLPAS